MNKVFVDTVGFLALWDDRDQWHSAAVAAFEQAKQKHMELVSSHLVFLELGNAAARKPYRDHVFQFKAAMDADGTLFELNSEELLEGWQRYHRRFANSAGIVDQTSFIVMRRPGITHALTNDEHFRAAGFTTLM